MNVERGGCEGGGVGLEKEAHKKNIKNSTKKLID